MNIKSPTFKRLLPGKRFRLFAKVTGFVFVLGFLGTAHGDPSAASKMAKMPAAPQAYQFEDYSKTHMVDEVTGDMGLTLPLFTIPGAGDLDYPVTLSYKSGIRLEQKASEVGLGWTLNHPTFHRSVNGVPDDISAGIDDDDNYFYFDHTPAVYPMSQFINQKKALDAAKKKANKSMITGAVVALAVSAATFGAGAVLAPGLMATGTAAFSTTMTSAAISTAVSSTAQYAQMQGEQAKSIGEMRANQARIRNMLESKSTDTDSSKIHGRIYYDASLNGTGDEHLNLDQGNADKYFVSSPAYIGELIMANRAGDSDEQVLWPTVYSSQTVHVDYLDNQLADFDSSYASDLPNLNNPFVTLTENNLVSLVDQDAFGTYQGFVLVDTNGNRYFFNDPIETNVLASNASDFIPSELLDIDAWPTTDVSSYSWRDHYPGGVDELPADLYGNANGSRYGAAEAILSEYDISWGLTRIQNGNRAIFGKGPELTLNTRSLIGTLPVIAFLQPAILVIRKRVTPILLWLT